KRFEHKHAAAFGARCTVAFGIEGAHSLLGIIASRSDRADHTEGHGIQGSYTGIGAASDGDVGIAAMNHTSSLANCIGSGGASRDGHRGRAVQIEVDGYLASRHIGNVGRKIECIVESLAFALCKGE